MSELMTFSMTSIAEAVRDLGFKAKVRISEKLSLIDSASGGQIFWLVCYNDEGAPIKTEEELVKIVHFCAEWTDLIDYNEFELDGLCNWYNRTHPFTKLYRGSRDDETALFLEADLYVMDGLSQDAFQERFLAFVGHFEHAKKSLASCKAVNKREILERHSKAIEILHGKGGESSDAVHMYRQNSYLGFAGSQNNFGDLFELGEIVPKDLALAMYWYTRSSERGEPTAYYSLADVLAKNEENMDAQVVAAQYALLASAHLPDGKNKLMAGQLVETLEERLGEDLFGYALQLARDYRPMYLEQWKMGDAPGAEFLEAPGSDAVN